MIFLGPEHVVAAVLKSAPKDIWMVILAFVRMAATRISSHPDLRNSGICFMLGEADYDRAYTLYKNIFEENRAPLPDGSAWLAVNRDELDRNYARVMDDVPDAVLAVLERVASGIPAENRRPIGLYAADIERAMTYVLPPKLRWGIGADPSEVLHRLELMQNIATHLPLMLQKVCPNRYLGSIFSDAYEHIAQKLNPESPEYLYACTLLAPYIFLSALCENPPGFARVPDASASPYPHPVAIHGRLLKSAPAGTSSVCHVPGCVFTDTASFLKGGVRAGEFFALERIERSDIVDLHRDLARLGVVRPKFGDHSCQ